MSYFNVVEVESAIQGLAAAYPGICELITLPEQTPEGRVCHALRIHVSSQRPFQNGVLIMGCAHANEWGGAEICVHFAADLLSAYTAHAGLTYGKKSFGRADIANIVTALDVIVFPLVNPDGRHYSQTTEVSWRKNRNPAASGGDPQRIGVDLNRNYDFLWDDPGLLSSADPGSRKYRGPTPNSEPEVQNVIWIVDNHPTISSVMDIHSDGGKVLWGWSDDESQTANPTMNFQNPAWYGQRGQVGDTYKEYLPSDDRNAVRVIANRVRDAINAVRGGSYLAMAGVGYYNQGISGVGADFLYSRHFVNAGAARVFGFGLEFGHESPVQDWNEMTKIIAEVDAGLIEFCLAHVVPVIRPPVRRNYDPNWWLKWNPAESFSPATRTAIIALAVHELASQIQSSELRQEIQQAALKAVIRETDLLLRTVGRG